MTSPSNTPDSIETTTALLRGELPQLETHQQSLERELASVTGRLESVRTALGALQALSPTPQAQETVPEQRAAEPSAAETPAAQAPVVVTPVAEAPAEKAPAEEAAAEAPAKEKPAPAKAAKSRKSASASSSARTSGGGSGAKSQTSKEQTAKEQAPKERTSRPAKKAAPATATKTRAKKTAAAVAPAPASEQASGLTEQILAVLAASDGNPVRARDVAQELGRDGTPGSINAVRSTLDRLVGTSRAHRAGRGLYQASAG
ncbi:hypothetical protein [Streptomyces sp. 35G-GA-8]|uniref:hypothetical protein n=1 Tax=Streptomyces sp. 35G-GA-8 TaxID=2939434 RepID=UPI00201FAAD6|nr:hypothetical protein [Streptomyces sp. 35G-GA-8]MCL7377806.1 hypothetical protein [Streptomyces sp. 35G-GA-8]